MPVYHCEPSLTALLLSLAPSSLVWSLAVVYGCLSSASLAMVTIVTMTAPVMWFPHHRGKVIGFIASGFGLASTGGNDYNYVNKKIKKNSIFGAQILKVGKKAFLILRKLLLNGQL